MKKSLLPLLFIVISIHVLKSQDYIPFPSDYAKWNTLYHGANGSSESVDNYSYVLEGDTTLNGKDYKKIYAHESDGAIFYFGGMREDSLKNIYFFPSDINQISFYFQFPSDTAEHLLYTFDSLYVGKILPINSGNTTMRVDGIDSILIGDTYHKRYRIYNELLFDDYWIEGIGSDSELFSPYAEEFEWQFFTLCFSDTATYQITSYAPGGSEFVGDDSCQVTIPVSINDIENNSFSSYPNPVEKELVISCNTEFKDGWVSLYNIQGQNIYTREIDHEETKFDVSFLNKGIYILELFIDSKIETKKIIKK